ncbi:unnamed protein product [Prorocentrum cordatum]|uniref:Uncharacterized protein n=1 Tax=Prorocentrum cordatum TaxID=2364126 RepID=A0ABN9WED3_9DINO|nr:unnamed protein product [Polarella glacialis]
MVRRSERQRWFMGSWRRWGPPAGRGPAAPGREEKEREEEEEQERTAQIGEGKEVSEESAAPSQMTVVHTCRGGDIPASDQRQTPHSKKLTEGRGLPFQLN